MTGPRPHVWLRGPVPGVPSTLQPVAHALLQAEEDVVEVLRDIRSVDLWRSIGGAASAGFHARHAAGSLERLFTYARGEMLSDAQQAALASEKSLPDPPIPAATLAAAFSAAVDGALAQLRATSESDLLAPRAVGRAALPSTVLGLLVHAAEHTQRHVGQLITTAKIARGLTERDG